MWPCLHGGEFCTGEARTAAIKIPRHTHSTSKSENIEFIVIYVFLHVIYCKPTKQDTRKIKIERETPLCNELKLYWS